MVTRRTFLEGIATATATAPTVTSQSESRTCDCDCKVVRSSEREGVAALSGQPDFTVETDEKTHRIYWREIPVEKFGTSVVGYAGLNDDYVVLNKAYDSIVDSTVLAHEVGHNLGYEHIDGTLMDPTIGGTTDANPSVEFTDVTRAVFEQMECAHLCDWREDSIDDLSTVATSFSNSSSSITTLQYAASRWAAADGTDAFYNHDSSWFDDHGISLDGQFYRT